MLICNSRKELTRHENFIPLEQRENNKKTNVGKWNVIFKGTNQHVVVNIDAVVCFILVLICIKSFLRARLVSGNRKPSCAFPVIPKSDYETVPLMKPDFTS